MKRIFLALLLFPISALSWDGFDYESGTNVEIEKGNLVRPGREIEYFDYGSGQYKSGEVESIRRSGRSVEVEVLDNESGEIRTFDMDGR
jgi:hypothetical protein